jgi:uncharacterized protein YecT (DUF1311 family)
LGKIPFVISVLCQDEYTNQNSIAQLYLTLKAKPPPPETAGMGSPPPPSPSRPNTSGLVSESRGEALADLQGAAERFIRLRVDNEIENNLREKTYTTVDNTRPMRVEFSNMLTAVTTGNYGSAFAEDSRAEQELSAAYRKVHQRVQALGVPSDLANLEETQSAWLAYRKAWLSYVAVANPAVPRKGVASFLTLERAAQLKAYYATGDR